MKICVPIREKNQAEVQKRLQEVHQSDADFAEIWLDSIADLDLKSLLSGIRPKVVAVCKKSNDQGQFKGSYKVMAELLEEACRLGAEYIDVPLKMPSEQIKSLQLKVKNFDSEVILSHHDFKKTPSLADLLKLAEKMAKLKPDVIKISTLATSDADAMNIITLAKMLEQQGISHILIGMGERGKLTRILTPTLGGEMMFAVLDKNQSTAPGQMTVKELKEAWTLLKT